MKRIEFIGASGVGKSTLFDELLKIRGPKDNWMSPKEAKIYLAKKEKVTGSIVQKTFQIYLKINLIKKFQAQMASIILNKHSKNIIDSLGDKYSDVASLKLDSVIESLRLDLLNKNNKRNAVKELFLLKYYYDSLYEIMLFDYLDLDRIVVFDDGIIHTNLAFSDKEKSSVVLEKHMNNKTSIIPRGGIYCKLSLPSNIERRKMRITNGKGAIIERNLNDGEIIDICKDSLKLTEDKINVLKSYNIPILEINMENDVEDNAKVVYNFIRQFH